MSDNKPLPEPPNVSLAPKEKILEREFAALTSCLKDAVVKTGQIYNFYADTRRLNIEKHVTDPPRSLTKVLGRDIEKYDQLCDSIEAHLLRAINLLKRDLRREEAKVEAEARRKNLEALMLPPVLPSSSEMSIDIPASQSTSDGNSTNPRNSPVLSTLARRPSAISISSLQRPQFPLKLDLSATSLRITEEEAALYSKGLASPVTLAPKSARPMGPNEFPPDLMAAFTSGSSVALDGNQDLNFPSPTKLELLGLGVGLGDSSDKPIELDLDAMDMEMVNMTGPFSNSTDAGRERPEGNDSTQPLQPAGETTSNNFHIDSAATDELFGSLTPSGDLGVDLDNSAASMMQSQSTSVPSPESLLAHLSDASSLINTKASSDNPTINDTDTGFDINTLDLAMDMSNLSSEFFSNHGSSDIQFMSMDMQEFLESQTALNMDSAADEKGSSEDPSKV